MPESPVHLLVTVTGTDRPGVMSRLFTTLAELRGADGAHPTLEVIDIEQVIIRGELVLGLELATSCDSEPIRAALDQVAADTGTTITVTTNPDPDYRKRRQARHHVVVLGKPLSPVAMAAVASSIAGLGANIDSIRRLSDYPVTAVELIVSGARSGRLRPALSATSARVGVDIAVERGGLDRRTKRLIVMDVDSTLVQGEVIDSLAAHAGRMEQVAAVTARAMRGELDFTESLHARVAMLEGLPASVVDEVRRELKLTPGAATLIRTLKRMGLKIGIVSGGFTQVTDVLVRDLGLDFGAANTLEIVDGRLTGKVVGTVIDRAGKLAALRRFADECGVPMEQTIAVGDGANDLDMLSKAGLGIAFNAKQVVREQSHTSLNYPYLDAILFFLGISQDEIVAAGCDAG